MLIESMHQVVPPRFRALVVDDEIHTQRLTARALAGEGFNCDTASDGNEALKLARAARYDVIVTDVRMPHRNGHSLCIELLEQPARPVLVVLTGVIEPRIARDLILRGVDEVCFKPVEVRAFATKVRALVERRMLQQDPLYQTGAGAGPGRHAFSPQPPVPEPTRDFPAPEPPAILPEESPQVGVAGMTARHVALILMRDRARGARLAEMLSDDNFDAVAANGSEEFRSLLNRQRVDLILIDQEQDGFLTGLEILDRLFKELLRPETILIAEPGWGTEEQAELLGVEKVMPADASLEELAESARVAILAKDVAQVFLSPRARRIVQLHENIPPLPQLLVKFLSYLSMETTEIPLKELANDISVDPKATATLLTLTNSTSLGLSQKVTRVFDALNLLGARKAIGLIVSSAAIANQSELIRNWSEPLRIWYHQRSVLIASTAATFARRLEKVSPDTAYVLGLLQDLGILLLGNTLRERYVEITLRRAREIGQLQLAAVEYQNHQFTHAEISAALLQRWKLPQSLVRLVLDHHNPNAGAELSKTDQCFLRVMQIGEAVADLSDTAHPVRRQHLNRLLAAYPVSEMQLCKDCISEAVAKTVDSCQLFSLPAPDPSTLERIREKLTLLQET